MNQAFATQQPQQGAQLCGSNPLASGLVFAVTGAPGTGFVDAVSGRLPTVTGASSGIDIKGRYAKPAASSGQITWPAGSTGLDRVTGPGTLLVCMRSNNNTRNWRAFGSREDSSTGDGVYLLYDDQNNASNGFNAGANNNNYRLSSNSGALGTNSEQSFHTFGFSWDGSTVWMWADGKQDKSAAAAFTPNSNTGRVTRLQSDTVASDFLFAYAWNRVLSANEIASITANPWQIFAAPRIAAAATSGGGSTGTLAATESADTATFSGVYAIYGTLSAVEGQDSASLTGAAVPPAVTGSLSAVDAADIASFAGSSALPGVSGSLSVIDQPDIASMAGGIAFAGSMAVAEPQDLAAFAGSAFAPGVSGVLSTVERADSAVFSGGYSLPVISGSMSAVDSQDGATFAGAFIASISGMLSAIEPVDSVSLSGLASAPAGATTEIDVDRWLLLPAESRVYVVEPESRVLELVGESRVLLVEE